MIERFFPTLKLPIPIELFETLPHNSAYKYEYYDNTAWLSLRPKSDQAVRTLTQDSARSEIVARQPVALRTLVDSDWEAFPEVFARAFRRVQPFASLDHGKRLEAARACMEATRGGHDGPVIAEACFTACAKPNRRLLGAILITLLPDHYANPLGGDRWKTPPPPDWRERQFGRPHLTRIFVEPSTARHGVGTALLNAATAPLQTLGYRELDSTFLLGNDASTLWHWRNGFVLRPWLGSPRHWRQPPR